MPELNSKLDLTNFRAAYTRTIILQPVLNETDFANSEIQEQTIHTSGLIMYLNNKLIT